MSKWVWLVVVSASLGGIGTACGAGGDALRRRASFDLDCPESRLRIVEIDSRTRGVTGCDRRVVYVESCQNPPGSFDRACTWVANTDSGTSSH